MKLTKDDFECIKAAVRDAIENDRELGSAYLSKIEVSADAHLFEACKRLAIDPVPELLINLGNYALLCLVNTEIVRLRSQREIQKIMNR